MKTQYSLNNLFIMSENEIIILPLRVMALNMLHLLCYIKLLFLKI